MRKSNTNCIDWGGRDVFTYNGYVGCLAASISLAIAQFLALYSPLLLTAQDAQIGGAVLVAVAASLCSVSLTFELYMNRKARSLLISLTVGIFALPAFIWAFKFHSVLAWGAIAIVCIRGAVVICRIRNFSLIAVVLAGAAIGYWVFLLTYVDGYKTPWIDEEVATGAVHVDMMFHAAIVNMLSGFNAPSLGVDGIAPFPYHFGSHRIVALLCHLLEIGPLKFYAVVFPLLFGPVFILSFFFFVLSFRSFLSRTEPVKAGEMKKSYSGWFWVAFFVVFVGLISTSDRRNLGVWDNVFHSESFGVAVLASYFAGIWIFDKLGRKNSDWLHWYAYPLIALYLIALCSLKISVGAVIGGLVAYIVLRLPLTWLQRGLAWLAMSSSVIYGYVVTQMIVQGENSGSGLMQMIKPFAFIRDVLPPERWASSFFAFFGPMIGFIGLRLLGSPLRTDVGLATTLRSVPRDIEMIIVITLISITPGLILSIPQGSTNFFSEVSYWWVQPMLAVALASTFSGLVGVRSK